MEATTDALYTVWSSKSLPPVVFSLGLFMHLIGRNDIVRVLLVLILLFVMLNNVLNNVQNGRVRLQAYCVDHVLLYVVCVILLDR